ncbi:tetratricopeptide repeat protein [Bdellovibrio reynosensis]|uniref:Tetratricopeptide repeat protein n=1 Tax=Bdellovibrio reynosensis TaxID=2835041 RepID=A0ABY4C6L4_9BACT|nr:tetratricopeptide repeat protein [Bdellovibrio reynosensis]UOF00560.1 tetratricopeptide repeat protein [Bdellovibrio reynosensis]
MKLLCLMTLLVLSGCGHFAKNNVEEEQAKAQRTAEENEIANAEKVLALGRFEEARILFRDFSGRKPQSVFYQSARLGEAQALDGAGKHQEAINLYREIWLKTQTEQPQISALALYQMASAYEAMGDDVKTIATLMDAKKMGQHLPPETVLAEIPARLAAVYARLGREKEAVQYLNEAESGMNRYLQSAGPNVKKEWIAKAYFQMGNITTNQLSEDNFEQVVNSQKVVQAYLIKALKANDPTWSARAEQKLTETFRDLNRQLEVLNGQQKRADLGGSLLELMDQAILYKPYEEQKQNQYEERFFRQLAEIRKQSEHALYSGGESMVLTTESQKLNSLKRESKLTIKPLLPEKEKSSIPFPPKVVPSEDPNL